MLLNFINLIILIFKNSDDKNINKAIDKHCVKSVHIWSFSGPYFHAFGLNVARYYVSTLIQFNCGKKLRIETYSVHMWENTDQKNSVYGHFSRSESHANAVRFILLDSGKQSLEETSSVENNIEDKIKTWNKEAPKKLYKEYQNIDQFYRPHK